MEKRIDIDDLNATIDSPMGRGLDGMEEFDLVCTELKRMYEREDELMEILSILEDRHDIDMSQFDASECGILEWKR